MNFRGGADSQVCRLFHTAPNGIIGFGVPRNSDPAPAMPTMPAMPAMPAMPLDPDDPDDAEWF